MADKNEGFTKYQPVGCNTPQQLSSERVLGGPGERFIGHNLISVRGLRPNWLIDEMPPRSPPFLFLRQTRGLSGLQGGVTAKYSVIHQLALR